MSNASNAKKKDQPLHDTLFNLCKDLLRFIDRKVIKKYISPNIAQIPKELRNVDIKSENEKKGWTYFYKDKEITEEEKLKDVFKDDIFLGHLENLTNSLIIVVDFLEQNQKTIKKLEEEIKNKEEKLNSLNELKNLLNNYFDKNNENKANPENNKNILYDQNLINIMSKIQSFNNKKTDIVSKITENEINFNNINNSSHSINNISNSSITNDLNNKSNISFNNNNTTKKEKINDIILNKEKISLKNDKNEINNQYLSDTSPNEIKIKNVDVSIKNEANFKDRNEIENLIDNLKVTKTIDIFKKEKIGEQNEDINQFLRINNNNQEANDKKFLNKKTEREKDTKRNEKEKISTTSNNKNLTSEKKKGKNKKKTQNINSEKEFLVQIPLKEVIEKLPVLTPKLEKNKEIIDIDSESKNEYKEKTKNNKITKIAQKENSDFSIDEDIVNGLLEDDEISKNGKRLKKISIEDEFDSQIIKSFSPLNQGNQRIKIIKEILSLIKNNDIINYNPRINGPYLIGSYKKISELPSLNYSAPIDILYTYKDILIDKKIIDYTIEHIMKNVLNLNIIERSDLDEEENKTRIIVKCKNKINDKDIISFYIIFADIGNEQNEQIINKLIFDGEKFKYEKIEEENKYINIILFLRIWRKKYKLFFLIPEILDEISRLNFDPNKSMGLIILNIFYYLYNGVNDFNFNQKYLNMLKHKILMENLIKNWYSNGNEKKKLKDAILHTNNLINNKKFEELFK